MAILPLWNWNNEGDNMKTSKILLYVAGYFAIISYIISLSNALKGINNDSGFLGLHVFGAIGFFLIAALYVHIEAQK